MTRRVAVTGVGVVAPGGIGVRAFWAMLTAGRSATRLATLFDSAGFRSRVAAECDWDPAAHGLEPDQVGRMDRYVQFAAVAATEAVRDAGLDVDRENAWRIGASHALPQTAGRRGNAAEPGSRQPTRPLPRRSPAARACGEAHASSGSVGRGA